MDYDEFLEFSKSERFKAFTEAMKSLSNPDMAGKINNAENVNNYVTLSEEQKNNLTAAQSLKKISDDLEILGRQDPKKPDFDVNTDAEDLADEKEMFAEQLESANLEKFAAYLDMVDFARNFENNYEAKLSGASKDEYDLIYNAHQITTEILSANEYANAVYDNMEIDSNKNSYEQAKNEYREAQENLDKAVNDFAAKHGDTTYKVSALSDDKADIDAFSAVFDESLYLDDNKVNAMEDNYQMASRNAREKFDKDVNAVKDELKAKTDKITANAEERMNALAGQDKKYDDRLKELEDIIKTEQPQETKTGYINLQNSINELENASKDIKLSDDVKVLGNDDFNAVKNSTDVKEFDGKISEINADITRKENQINLLNVELSDLTNEYNNKVQSEKSAIKEYTEKAEEASKNLLYYNTLVADKQLNVDDIDKDALKTDELKDKYYDAIKAFVNSNNAYEDFGKAIKDNKVVNTVNKDLDKYFTAQQKLFNEIDRLKKNNYGFPFDNELPDNISKDTQKTLTGLNADNNFSVMSKEVFVLGNKVKGNLAIAEDMNDKISPDIKDYKQLKNAFNDYVKAAKKIEGDLKPYDKFIEDISVQKNNYNACVGSIYDDFKKTRDEYQKEFNECTEKLNSIDPEKTEKSFNEKKESILAQNDVLNNDINYLNKAKNVFEKGAQWTKDKTEDPVYKAKLELPEAKENVFKKNRKIADATEKINDIKASSLSKAKQESTAEINKIGDRYKAEVKALSDVKKSVDSFTKDTAEIKNACRNLKEKAQPLIEAKNNLDTKYMLSKEKLERAHDKELKQFGEKENKLLTDILNSKKKFGFNSSVFDKVKDSAQALLNYKNSNPNGSREQLNELKQNLMTSLDNYIEARGTGSKKMTAEGQHRLDAIKNMKSLLENEKKVDAAYERDKNALEINFKTDIEKPKSMLEVNSAFGGKLVNQNIFPDEAVRDAFKVKVDRKIAANKEAEAKTNSKVNDVSKPEVKKADIQKGGI